MHTKKGSEHACHLYFERNLTGNFSWFSCCLSAAEGGDGGGGAFGSAAFSLTLSSHLSSFPILLPATNLALVYNRSANLPIQHPTTQPVPGFLLHGLVTQQFP